MKSRIFSHSLAALVMLALLLSLTGTAQADSVGPCGPYVVQTGNFFTITPNGSDDTASIQCALDSASAAGPGSTVQFKAGTFHSGFIGANMLNGTIKGAGMDKSIIEVLPDLTCSSGGTMFFGIISSRLRMADLSIHIPDETPCDVENYDIGKALLDVIVIDGAQPWEGPDVCLPFSQDHPVDISVDSISIIGNNGDWGDPNYPNYLHVNAINGLGVWDYCNNTPPGVQNWSVKVTRSRFEHLGTPIHMGWLKGMHVQVGGSPNEGNYFNNNFNPTRFDFNRNSVFGVSYNKMQNTFGDGFSAWSDGATELSIYQVHHNTIGVVGNGNGAWVEDDSFLNGTPAMSASITQNDFILNGPTADGIVALDGKNFLLANNRFSGYALFGINAGQWGYEGDPLVTADGFLIKANNLNKLKTDIAPIILTNTSANCVVVGTNKENVEDHGTNNVITGATRHNGNSIGKAISEKMRIKADMWKMFKHRK